jgi:hypothetical protein
VCVPQRHTGTNPTYWPNETRRNKPFHFVARTPWPTTYIHPQPHFYPSTPSTPHVIRHLAASTPRTARVHVFTLYHDPTAQRGRWQPACFVAHDRTLMQYVEDYREEVSAADVPWEEWGPHGTRLFVLAVGGCGGLEPFYELMR